MKTKDEGINQSTLLAYLVMPKDHKAYSKPTGDVHVGKSRIVSQPNCIYAIDLIQRSRLERSSGIAAILKLQD